MTHIGLAWIVKVKGHPKQMTLCLDRETRDTIAAHLASIWPGRITVESITAHASKSGIVAPILERS